MVSDSAKDSLVGRGGEVGDVLFFFSSRRRHTRFDCDWSSDVCSSDLVCRAIQLLIKARQTFEQHHGPDHPDTLLAANNLALAYKTDGQLSRALPLFAETRSEERRVGKESGARWGGCEREHKRYECRVS